MRTCANCRHWRTFEPDAGPDDDHYCAMASTVEGIESGSQAVAWSPTAATAYLTTDAHYCCTQHEYRRLPEREDGE